MLDPGDGRYSPEIVKSSFRSRKKSRKLNKEAKIVTNLIEENKANSTQTDISISELEPIIESCDQTPSNASISASTSPSIIVNDPISSCVQNQNPIALPELSRRVVDTKENLISSKQALPKASNTSGTINTSLSLNGPKDIKPSSLAELCLHVINSTKKIISFEPDVSTSHAQEVSQKNSIFCNSNLLADYEHLSLVDNFDEEMGCYIADEVVLLKDSAKQPSLNTLITQDLQQGPSVSPKSTSNFDLLRVIESPQDLNNALDVTPSCSRDPVLGCISPYSNSGDFSPDDGDPDYQPTELARHSSSESVDLEINNSETNGKRHRAKRGRPNKECWISEVNKNKRMKGETYEGRRKTEEGKIVFDIPRNERSLKPRCSHTETSKYFQCSKVTEENRQSNFNDYWKLSWQAKKVWVKKTVNCQSVSRRKCASDARRDNTYKYTLTTPEGQYTVCKKMYLHTLNIGEWTVHNWSRNEAHKIHTKNRNSTIKEQEEEGRKYLREYLNMLPKLESHYCRKSTTKLYLERSWNSKQSLYREYLNYLTEKGKNDSKVSNFLFWEEFDKMNLSLFSPKKDECDVCCAKRVGNLSDEDYNAHILRKDKARQEKSTDKNISDPSVKVFTFDLQAVLLSPALNASALYYKTKLKVHNFTIFDLKTSEGHCFIWHECEGGVTADEFASILYHFLQNNIDDTVKQVIFWSDGCTNQNRNAILANALLLAAVKKSMTITHKYLEKGHTQMECDSMHATIERKLKNREIYSPAQYLEICKTARLTKPYYVEYLQHTFFHKFSCMPYLNSIRPGKKTGDATVFDLRCIEYRSDGTIFYKKVHNEDFTQLSKKIKMPGQSDTTPLLYDSRLPIPRSKYIHLQELKSVLPIDVHSFYDQLPHQCSEQRRNNTCTCRRVVLSE